jgi:hypothetical protein
MFVDVCHGFVSFCSDILYYYYYYYKIIIKTYIYIFNINMYIFVIFVLKHTLTLRNLINT